MYPAVELGIGYGVKCSSMKVTPSDPVSFDPQAIAVEYYFGDLSYPNRPKRLSKGICYQVHKEHQLFSFDGQLRMMDRGRVSTFFTCVLTKNRCPSWLTS